MKMPWEDQTGLTKAAAILAAGFVLSFGLCGLNFVAVVSINRNDGGLLLATAYVELAGMIFCGAGLIVVAILAICKTIYRRLGKQDAISSQDDDDQGPQ